MNHTIELGAATIRALRKTGIRQHAGGRKPAQLANGNFAVLVSRWDAEIIAARTLPGEMAEDCIRRELDLSAEQRT